MCFGVSSLWPDCFIYLEGISNSKSFAIMVHGKGLRTPSRSTLGAVEHCGGSNPCIVVAVDALNYGWVRGRKSGELQREVKRINGRLGEFLDSIGNIDYNAANNKMSHRVIDRLVKNFKWYHRKDRNSDLLQRLKERQLWGDDGAEKVRTKYVSNNSVKHSFGNGACIGLGFVQHQLESMVREEELQEIIRQADTSIPLTPKVLIGRGGTTTATACRVY